MSSLKSIEEEWNDFRKIVESMPNAAGITPLEYELMRHTFYAGFGAAIKQINRIAGKEISREEALTHLDSIDHELRRFVKRITLHSGGWIDSCYRGH